MNQKVRLIFHWVMLPCTAPPSCRSQCYRYREELTKSSGISSLLVITDMLSDECFLPFLASG